MLKKEFRLIITFRDTVMAIRMEKAMKGSRAARADHPASQCHFRRLRPVLYGTVRCREALEQEMKRQDITWELITELML